MKSIVLLFLVYSFKLPAQIYSSQSKDNISILSLEKPVLVTPDRFLQKSDQVSTSVQIITAQHIHETGKNTLSQLLKSVSSSNTIQSGGPGQTSAFRLRGTKPEHTLFLLDGVTLNDPSTPSGQFDIGQMSLADLEQVEIVKGSQSVVYGSHAIGGVVHLKTKRTARPTLQLGLGSRGMHRESLWYGNQAIWLSLDQFRTQGFSAAADPRVQSDADAHQSVMAKTHFTFRPYRDSQMALKLQFTDSKTETDVSAFVDDPNSYAKKQLQMGQIELTTPSFSDLYQARVQFSQSLNKRRYFDAADPYNPTIFEGTFRGERTKLSIQNHFFIDDLWTFNLGIDRVQEVGRSTSSFGNFSKQKSQSDGYFSQLIYESHFLFGNLGVRHEKHYQFGQVTNFKIAPGLNIHSLDIQVKSHFATGFKAPSLYQLYGPYGQQQLEPDRSRSFDLSVEKNFLEKMRIAVGFFQVEVDHSIEFNPLTLRYQNNGQTRSQGFDLHFQWRLSSYWNFFSETTFTQAYELKTKNPLPATPKWRSHMQLIFEPNDIYSIGFEGEYMGKRRDYSLRSNPSFTLFNLYTNYRFSEDLSTLARIDNLFNREYQAIKGYNSPGMTLSAHLKLQL